MHICLVTQFLSQIIVQHLELSFDIQRQIVSSTNTLTGCVPIQANSSPCWQVYCELFTQKIKKNTLKQRSLSSAVIDIQAFRKKDCYPVCWAWILNVIIAIYITKNNMSSKTTWIYDVPMLPQNLFSKCLKEKIWSMEYITKNHLICVPPRGEFHEMCTYCIKEINRTIQYPVTS